MEFVLLQTLSCLFHLFQLIKCWQILLEFNSKKTVSKFRKRKRKLSCVHVLHKPSNCAFSRRSREVTAKKWTKKSALHMQRKPKPIGFLTFSRPSPSSLLKLPKNRLQSPELHSLFTWLDVLSDDTYPDEDERSRASASLSEDLISRERLWSPADSLSWLRWPTKCIVCLLGSALFVSDAGEFLCGLAVAWEGLSGWSTRSASFLATVLNWKQTKTWSYF